jgi:hypothetical protein
MSGNQKVQSTAADELLSPVRALINTRDAHGSLAREILKDLTGDRFLQLNVCGELAPPADATQVEKARARVVAPPLGWLLSKLARDWMDASLIGGSTGNDQSNCYATNAQAIATLKNRLHLDR